MEPKRLGHQKNDGDLSVVPERLTFSSGRFLRIRHVSSLIVLFRLVFLLMNSSRFSSRFSPRLVSLQLQAPPPQTRGGLTGAYLTGDFSLQVDAMDTNLQALERGRGSSKRARDVTAHRHAIKGKGLLVLVLTLVEVLP